jgi:predicted TIM-barrel fold metal-dependent hydrolase
LRYRGAAAGVGPSIELSWADAGVGPRPAVNDRITIQKDPHDGTGRNEMYRTASGEEIFVIDGHTHFWDGSPANQKNIHGKQFIECFYAYHSNLSPPSEKWPLEKFEKYDAKTMYDDLFIHGYDDMAILQPTYLGDFYKNGFNTTERNSAMKKSHPDRFILNSAFDPRDGNKGLEDLHAKVEKYKVRGVKLYTAEWRGESKGYKLTDKESYRFLEAAQKLGIKNVHVHKGPTIIPLNKDAFDVGDIDDVATAFQDLNFIVEHCGLPRLDDFCWIATQETNVYGGLAVALPFIHTRPGYFAHIISELLFWLGPDKLLYGSDYGIWTPKWLIDKFMAFEIPADETKETGSVLTLETKKKILGENAARLYGIDIEAQKKKIKAAGGYAHLADAVHAAE